MFMVILVNLKSRDEILVGFNHIVLQNCDYLKWGIKYLYTLSTWGITKAIVVYKLWGPRPAGGSG